ncbi:MAG TPA: DUF3175 domain-containing protein [Nitrospiraceae bacterium]|nr:DUF3175 domain-containing protein [Nitrospiraceae bacterium]
MATKASRSRKPQGRKGRRWSADVMKRSNALDLEPGVFTKQSPRQIASSLKRSATRSKRRKGTPYQSAMSMLNFHINRGGKGLSATQKSRLERAKGELRKMFGRA